MMSRFSISASGVGASGTSSSRTSGLPVMEGKFVEVSDARLRCLHHGPFKSYVSVFFMKFDTHPPPCNANNVGTVQLCNAEIA